MLSPNECPSTEGCTCGDKFGMLHNHRLKSITSGPQKSFATNHGNPRSTPELHRYFRSGLGAWPCCSLFLGLRLYFPVNRCTIDFCLVIQLRKQRLFGNAEALKFRFDFMFAGEDDPVSSQVHAQSSHQEWARRSRFLSPTPKSKNAPSCLAIRALSNLALNTENSMQIKAILIRARNPGFSPLMSCNRRRTSSSPC